MTIRFTKLRALAMGLTVGSLVVALLFDWNWLRSPLAGYLSARLGRELTIHGNLEIGLSRRLFIQADEVVLANAAWAGPEPMAQAARVALRVDLGALWSRRLVLSEVVLVRPRLLLERNAAGEGNWIVRPPSADAKAPPAIGSPNITDGRLHYRDPRAKTDIRLDLGSVVSGEAALPLEFAGEGTLRGQAFAIKGRGAPLLALRDSSKPYRLDVQASAGRTRAHFAGSLVPLQWRDIDGSLTLQGADLSELYPAMPVPLPWTPPYRFSGQLLHDHGRWIFRDFSGKVGRSDLQGEITIDRRGGRPQIDATVRSAYLDYQDLGGFVGLQQEPAARPQKKTVARRVASGKVLSDQPFELDRLRAVDAKVRFTGARIKRGKLPFDHLSVVLALHAGELRLQPIEFGIAGGRVVSQLTLDARRQTLRATARTSVRELDLARLMPKLKPPRGKSGKVSGRAQLAASGNLVAALLASLDGEIALGMAGGQASALTLFLTNLDLARAGELLLRGDENAAIHCVVADLAVKRGVMVARTLVADTTAVHIEGEGSVDLRAENYDLVLRAKSKQASLALRGPIVVAGSFRQPQVSPAPGPVAARLGAAVALGILATPLAALLPLIDPGGSEDSDCRALLAAAENRRRGTAAERP
ncbi:MAG: AsmA family protein [Candidatus Accumulibacter sp. UW20]|jgi:uncharacterized protein involved in outer membrane biogenesis